MAAMLRLGETNPPERRCWMAVEDGELVGHAQLAYDWRNGSARIGRVAVAPAFRGGGLAKPMLRLVIAEAFANTAIERLELYAIAYNRHAIGIYESLGFVHEGEARAAIRIGNERFGNLTMSMLRPEYRREGMPASADARGTRRPS
jgi:RimJ/RimL family protein N-acetyltransferase